MITELQAAKRREHLGSSDIAVMLGIDPFGKTPYDLVLEKRGELLPQPANEAMTRGNLLEDSILTYCEQELGKRLTKVGIERRVKDLPILVHADAKVAESGLPVDAKSSSSGMLWGDPGTSDVPDYVFVQAQTHMLAFEADLCYIPALLVKGGFKFALYTVKREESVINMIIERAQQFWQDYIVDKQTPPGTGSIEMLKRRRPSLGKIINCPDELEEKVFRYNELSKLAAEQSEVVERLKAEIMTAMGDAEIMQCPGGHFSRKIIANKGYTRTVAPYEYVRFGWSKH